MKILVTGFESWGLHRRNVSKEVIEELQKQNQDPNISFITLAVSDLGIESFKSYLRIKKPEAIVSLGHVSFSKTFRVENFANGNDGEKILSPLAGYLALSTRSYLGDGIGNWYCNKLYANALAYTKKSVFIHLGSKVDKEFAVKKIQDMLKVLRRIRTIKDGKENIQGERDEER